MLEAIKIGVYADTYIGDADAPDELIPFLSVDTTDNDLIEEVPDQYFEGLGKQLQVGTHRVSVTGSFYAGSSDLLIYNVLRGVSVSNTDRDTPPGNTFYTLLMVYPDEDIDQSILIPRCRVPRRLSEKFSKSTPSVLDLTFIAEDRNRFKQIHYYDTVDNLAAILGSRSPI